jgi:hypothetical protein
MTTLAATLSNSSIVIEAPCVLCVKEFLLSNKSENPHKKIINDSRLYLHKKNENGDLKSFLSQNIQENHISKKLF